MEQSVPLSLVENPLVEVKNVLHERIPLTAKPGCELVVLVDVPRVTEGAPVVSVDKVLLVRIEESDTVAADERYHI